MAAAAGEDAAAASSNVPVRFGAFTGVFTPTLLSIFVRDSGRESALV